MNKGIYTIDYLLLFKAITYEFSYYIDAGKNITVKSKAIGTYKYFV